MVLCLLCFKWRRIGSYLVYTEMLINVASLFYPNTRNSNATFFSYRNVNIALFATGYCGQVTSIYFLTLTMIVQSYLGLNVIYLKPVEAISILVGIYYALSFLIQLTFLHAALSYISELQRQQNLANEEQIKLLNGMHEGLLILRTCEQKILFCNKPAKSLLKNFVAWSKAESRLENILKRPSFTQVLKEKKEHYRQRNTLSQLAQHQ